MNVTTRSGALRGVTALATLAALALLPVLAAPAAAAPAHTSVVDEVVARASTGAPVRSSFNGSHLKSATPIARSTATSDAADYEPAELLPGRNVLLSVYSESMDRDIPLEVLLPKDRGVAAPVLYIFNGIDGGVAESNWNNNTDMQRYFEDVNVNVVMPLAGQFSYYTDWNEPVAAMDGKNMWTTFLTQELPSIVDTALNTNGKNAIAGLSMAGGAVLSLAEWGSDRGPDGGPLYRAVGAYSGCAQTSTSPGQEFVRVVTQGRGGIDPELMWGPVGGQRWVENDPTVNAEKLRGVPYIYVSTATGLPGEYDQLDGPIAKGDVETAATLWVLGGTIEAATEHCTRVLQTRLDSLGIPADFNFRPAGTHTWLYWQDDLHQSWPGMAAVLDVPPTATR